METTAHAVRDQRNIRKHVNKITLEGVVLTDPKLKPLSSGTKSVVFKICSYETFMTKGKQNYHANEFIVEALGSAAERVYRQVRKGGRYMFDGYLRSDRYEKGAKKGQRIRVRIFHADRF